MKRILKRLVWLAAAVGAALFLVFAVADHPGEKKQDAWQEARTGADGAASDPSEEFFAEESADGAEDAEEVVVHVAGAVEQPGVYRMQEGQRVEDAVRAASPDADADVDALNRAAVLTDGQKIVVPSQEETAAVEEDPLVDLNRADLEELMSLPGIGEVKAQAIIDHRESEGPFGRIEDLQKVSGIGEALFERVKSLIKI